MSFITSQEKRIHNIYKNFVDSNNMSQRKQRYLKLVENKPRIMYGSRKVHINFFDDCPRPILSALLTPICKLAKFSVAILEPVTTQSKIRLILTVNF